MAKDNLGLVAFAQAALAGGCGYVYGTFGQACTATLLDQKAKQYPDGNLAGGPMRTAGNRWIGRRVTDCIGLIKYYLMADKYGADPKYLQQYDTLNANALFGAAKESGPISTLPEIPGLLLHMPGHVGIYIGGGYAIEARGTVYGVVKTVVAGRGWDHWYKCIWLDYAAAPRTAVEIDTTMDLSRAHGQYYTVKTVCPQQVTLTPGTGGVATVVPFPKTGNVQLFALVAIGAPGTETGIYTAAPGEPALKRFVMRVK